MPRWYHCEAQAITSTEDIHPFLIARECALLEENDFETVHLIDLDQHGLTVDDAINIPAADPRVRAFRVEQITRIDVREIKRAQ